jgi:hypothetical protein
MSEGHERQHERLEREAADMQEKSERLGDEISRTRRDWEAQKTDEGVPGAQSPEGGLPPEANYTTRGDEPPDDGGDGAREPWPDE